MGSSFGELLELEEKEEDLGEEAQFLLFEGWKLSGEAQFDKILHQSHLVKLTDDEGSRHYYGVSARFRHNLTRHFMINT